MDISEGLVIVGINNNSPQFRDRCFHKFRSY